MEKLKLNKIALLTFIVSSATALSFHVLANKSETHKLEYKIYLNGEKPQINEDEPKIRKASSNNPSIELYMAKGEFEIFTLKFTHLKSSELIKDVTLDLKPISSLHSSMSDASGTIKKDSPQSTNISLNTYWLGVHHIKKSSYKSSTQSLEASDIAIPLDFMLSKDASPPQYNYASTAQFLFEIQTETTTPATEYEGHISFKVGSQKITLPLKIKVADVTLPQQFELLTSFGFAPWEVLKKHYGAWHKDEMALYDQYTSLGLEHRIDLHKLYVKFPEKNAEDPLEEAPVKNQSFLGQTTPLYTGRSTHKKNNLAITDLPVPEEYKNFTKEGPTSDTQKEKFWKKLNKSVLKHNLQDKTFVYYVDEPKTDTLKRLGEDLRRIRAWAPDLKFLVTTPYRPSLEGAVNVWCINLILWNRPTEKSPDFYLKRQKEKNEDLWFYVGCNSHGCDGPEDIENPDLIIDRASAYQRVFPWVALKYEARGILYYDTVYGYTKGHADSPWKDDFHFTGYGEGNLFYPCTEKLGKCKTPRVFPSLRLKILRDGLEDVQIIKMALKKNPKIESSKLISTAIKSERDFSHKTQDFEAIKRQSLYEFKDKKDIK